MLLFFGQVRLQALVQKCVVNLLNPTCHRGSAILREAGQMRTHSKAAKTCTWMSG